MLAPLAVLFLAGALSSLPKAAAWPLHHGYGGVLGDLGLGLLTSLLGHVNPDRSAAAAGLFCFAAGLMVLMSSLGLTQRDLKLICQADVRRSPTLDAMAGSRRRGLRELAASCRGVRAPPRRPVPTRMREPPITRASPRSSSWTDQPGRRDRPSGRRARCRTRDAGLGPRRRLRPAHRSGEPRHRRALRTRDGTPRASRVGAREPELPLPRS